MTKEQLNDYSKEELIYLIESYQNYVREMNVKKKPKNEVKQTFNFTSPRVTDIKTRFTYDDHSHFMINDSKNIVLQKANHDQYQVPTENEKAIIKYKQVVNLLLDAAATEQRTDLIAEVQDILNN